MIHWTCPVSLLRGCWFSFLSYLNRYCVDAERPIRLSITLAGVVNLHLLNGGGEYDGGIRKGRYIRLLFLILVSIAVKVHAEVHAALGGAFLGFVLSS